MKHRDKLMGRWHIGYSQGLFLFFIHTAAGPAASGRPALEATTMGLPGPAPSFATARELRPSEQQWGARHAQRTPEVQGPILKVLTFILGSGFASAYRVYLD